MANHVGGRHMHHAPNGPCRKEISIIKHFTYRIREKQEARTKTCTALTSKAVVINRLLSHTPPTLPSHTVSGTTSEEEEEKSLQSRLKH